MRRHFHVGIVERGILRRMREFLIVAISGVETRRQVLDRLDKQRALLKTELGDIQTIHE